jgi:alpha-methylacyl-CoA racemase
VAGPLSGLKVVELNCRGPGPFAGMLLADLGADVVAIARPSDVVTDHDEDGMERLLRGHRRIDLVTRGKRSVAIDLKHPEGVAVALRMIGRADVVIEGSRPGVSERLGLGPETCLGRNPRLVYGRVTGWGRDGPYAHLPGHDVNYVALAGALDHLRHPGQSPLPPLNLLGDYGGGGMLLAVGILGALVERATSGRGQVVDAAMVDGVSLLMTLFFGLRAEGLWSDEPASNILDLGAPHYNVYETSDGRYVSVGAGEPKFYRELLQRLGVGESLLQQQGQPETWSSGRELLAATFKQKTLTEWCELLEGTETCFAPVLTMAEAPTHPHHVARSTFVDVDGVVQPAAAPRFDRTPTAPPGPPVVAGRDTVDALVDWGEEPAEVRALVEAGALRQAPPAQPG